jgi:hypothetical protein
MLNYGINIILFSLIDNQYEIAFQSYSENYKNRISGD